MPVKSNDVVTGGNVTPAVSGTNDSVDVEASACYLAKIPTSIRYKIVKTRWYHRAFDAIFKNVTKTKICEIILLLHYWLNRHNTDV